MKKKSKVYTMVLAAMFLALAYVLPFLTGQIPEIGAMLCPMHIPVLLCGFLCGGQWGALVGLSAPLLRSMILGMPPMFPTAVCMACELTGYGAVTGVLYRRIPERVKAKRHGQKLWLYLTLLTAMITGRIVWGVAMYLCTGINGGEFGMAAFLAGAVTNAIPGIVVQLLLIPVLIMALHKQTAE